MNEVKKIESVIVEDNTNREELIEENVMTVFLDGEHIDHFLDKLNRSLWMLILFFCIPYFVYLFFQVF